MESESVWLSIIEYSNYRKISISTIRRYIRDNRVQHKQIKGKYFIAENKERYLSRMSEKSQDTVDVKKLKNLVKELREENDELKMLVSLYENQKQAPPELPLN